MLWIALLVFVVFLIWLIRKPFPEQQAPKVQVSASPVIQPVQAVQVTEDEDVLAVIMAAVAEYEGTSDFQVLSIRPSGTNWKLTARQELLHGRI